jgi:hypothetical protein
MVLHTGPFLPISVDLERTVLLEADQSTHSSIKKKLVSRLRRSVTVTVIGYPSWYCTTVQAYNTNTT